MPSWSRYFVISRGTGVLGGLQRWWLQPITSQWEPLTLFFGALSLIAVTDKGLTNPAGSRFSSEGSQTSRSVQVVSCSER